MEPTLPDTTGLLAPGFMDGSAQFGLALLLGHSRRHLDITHDSPPQEMEVGLETQVSIFRRQIQTQVAPDALRHLFRGIIEQAAKAPAQRSGVVQSRHERE